MTQNQWKKEEKIQRKLTSLASEAIRCVRTVKSFASEDLETAKYDEKLSNLHINAKKDIILKPVLQTVERVLDCRPRSYAKQGDNALGSVCLSVCSSVCALMAEP